MLNIMIYIYIAQKIKISLKCIEIKSKTKNYYLIYFTVIFSRL